MRDRYDRHVRRARLSVPPGASLHRLAFTVEEAMRLVSLPGENEGRSYYFRRLRVTGLPASGLREAWLDKFQRALDDCAAQAVHGADPRAAFAPSVFFRSEEEANEILLHRILARQTIHEWFWPMVAAPETGGGESAWNERTLLAILQKLRSRPASWVAVAAAIFAVPQFDAAAQLNAIPPSEAQAWLLEMDRSRPRQTAIVASIPRPAQTAIRQALRDFGFQDARTLWLAAVAVLLDSPSELAAGTAVWRARCALQSMASGAGNALAAPSATMPPIVTDGQTLSGQPAAAVTEDAVDGATSAPASVPADATVPIADRPEPAKSESAYLPDSGESRVPEFAEPESAGPLPDFVEPLHASAPPGAPEPAPSQALAFEEPAALPQITPWRCSGLPTNAAGLFFMLNAMERIGISQALAGGLGSVEPSFAALVLRRLASAGGVGRNDPALLWLDSLTPDRMNEEPLPCDASWWPSNLRISRDAATMNHLVRAWALAARRWCWRNARLRAGDIVLRSGVFSVNRTDLDVSLPLELADIRVRRVGLDLDPGWLPWFGRVVRFHYLHRGESHG
jgi:hypothetical protein